jgi:hypothetical protein
MKGRLIAMIMGTSLMFSASQAMAQTPPKPTKLPERVASFSRDKLGNLEATFSFRDVVDSEVRRKLHSGLTTVIVLAGGAFMMNEEGTPVPGTGIWQSCRVTFDVWNEVYRLQITGPTGERSSVAVNTEGVLRRCAQVRKLPIQGYLDPSQRYFLAATVEVNPVSQEMVEQVRRWVSRPPGSAAATPGDSLFGSFVGLFVARIGKADRTLSFRTQAFSPPP